MLRSAEQAVIIDAVLAGQSVVANAVAGAGKTSTVLMLSKETDKNILSITYNSILADEVRKKAQERDITNLEIHTYHSFALKYYMQSGFTDTDLQNMLKMNLPPKQGAPSFDVVVIDEAQDMTPLYYRTMDKFFYESAEKQTLLILGDKEQGLYQFKGADSRYLTLASQIRFSHKVHSFKHCTLQTSYRLPTPIAWFINNCMLGENRIIAVKPGPKVEYVSCDTSHNMFTGKEPNTYKYIVKAIVQELRNKTLTPGDIFILAPSVTSKNSPIKKIENDLVLDGYKCFVPNADDEKINEDSARGKIVFSTFHQAKGRERPFVIVLGFDESYFKFYGRDLSDAVCPSTLYVAATRASYRLMLIKDSKQKPLPFLRMNFTPEELKYVSCVGHGFHGRKIDSRNKDADTNHHDACPTELVRFLRIEHLARAFEILPTLFTNMNEMAPLVKIKNSQDNEKVAHLNGIAIPAVYARYKCGKVYLDNMNSQMMGALERNNEYTRVQFYKKHNDRISSMPESIAQHLYKVNLYSSMKESLFNSLEQIKSYDWLSAHQIDTYVKVMEKYVAPTTEFEYDQLPLYKHQSEKYGEIHVSAVFDGLNADTLWEFKCVETLQIEHYLQLVVYAWLWNMQNGAKNMRAFKLLNIRTDFVTELIYDHDKIVEIVEILFDNKYGPQNVLSNEEFIAANQPTEPARDDEVWNVENDSALLDD